MTATDTNNAAAAVGTWGVTIHGPTGPQETTLELNSADGVLGGVQSAASGEIVWINKIKKPLPLKLEFRGVVEGNLMSGKVKAGIMGSFPFTAVKN